MMSILLAFIAVAVFFYSKAAAVVIYLIPVIYLIVNLWALRKIRGKAPPELSERARNLIMRYPHWYTYPNVAKDNGAAARGLVVFAVILGVLSYIYSFSWGLVAAVIAIPLMVFVSRKVDPIRYLKDEAQKKAHEKIVAFILRN
jgi:hypothetical protein